ncbi:hypothetical protein [Streptomyces sp. SID5643]|uniref:hypothetical protein n=1 Tax=Streptomyces sp. SID5643 TaxID=2690307 RepID=UPI00137212E1|nr:hypothetical protein [Streptomyces sp. SID5643]MZF84092.1 hypothetical protein [Streptomyces sp. SID5643]
MSSTAAPTGQKRLIVLIVVLVAVIAAMVAGLLATAGGAALPGAFLTGGGAFVATATVGLLITNACGWT